MKQKEKPCNKSYSVPIINLSNCNLSNKEKQQVNLVWIINLLNKLKKVPKLLAANMKYLGDSSVLCSSLGQVFLKSYKFPCIPIFDNF